MENFIIITMEVQGKIKVIGETKSFGSGWRIERVAPAGAPQAGAPEVPPFDEFEPIQNSKDEDHDDLPF